MELRKYTTILVFWNLLYIISATFMCTSTNNCICSTIQTHYEYQCPMDDPSIVVKVFPEYGLYVQCLQEIEWETQNYPSIELQNAESVMFRACSLPKMRLIDVINNLGVNKTKELKFDFSPYFENITLSSNYFEGLDDLEKLILSDNNIRLIDSDVFKSLQNLTEIDLRSNTIQLVPNMFKYSSQLRLLDLAQNELTNLPSNIFRGMTELRVLYLWSNKLTSLNSMIFEDLQNLQTLELRNNHLRDLTADVFYSLKNLKTVSLAMNMLETIPQSLFKRNELLELIKLERNLHLTQLPNYLFSNLTKLGDILLNDCKLKKLPNRLFEGSLHLKNLSLQKNEIEQLPHELFKDLNELKNLDLSFNYLGDLPDGIFSTLTELRTLNLENNFLTSISKMLLYNLRNLEKINLKSNKIAYLHKQSFQGTINLKKIVLAYNYLDLAENQTIVSPFNTNLMLEEVDLSHNNISSISEDWMISKVHLRNLDFSYNQITFLDFNNLNVVSKPLVINLSHNKITIVNFANAEVLAQEQGNLDAYSSNSANTVVQLDGNPIQCDCNIYDFVRYFDRSIDPIVPTLVTVLADNLMCSSPQNLIGFPIKKLKPKMLICKLEQLEKNSVCPENCTCAIRPWDKSFIINCDSSNFTHAPQIVLPKTNIFNHTEVSLQGNKLISGPNESIAYTNVTKLYLSSNRINKITWIPPKIEILHLDNNNISYLGYEVLTMLNKTTLTNLTLGNNPWHCDCRTLNFSSFLVSQLTHKQIDANYIRCQENDKIVVQLNINELCPTSAAFIIGLCVTIASFAVIIGTLIALFYRFETQLKVWLFAHNLCLWCVTEEEVDKDKLYDAFISYSHNDEEFVVNQLLPILEQGPKPYKLCLHIRDWIAGEFISKQIVRSVENSRRTIVILSPTFLQSVWGKMEFRTAHTQAMAEGRVRVIVILYGDVDLNDDLDDELKAYIKTNTYIKWGDPWFWDKLRYALPHSRVKVSKKSQKNQNIMISLNDKLDLINMIPSTPNPGSTPPAINVDPPLLLKSHPLNFKTSETLTPPAEAGLNPLLLTVNQ